MPLKLILLIAFSAATAFFVGRGFVQPSLEPTARLEQPASNDPGRPYRGGANAPVTIVEYGDYQCPPCFPYIRILDEVMARYGDKVRLEFRHFPMTGIHPNAVKAALAVEAAGQQGHYWEMHDLVLSSQKEWSRLDNTEPVFAKLAASIGLDSKRLVETAAKPETEQRVAADIAKGKEVGIQAVPTFFINGRQISPPPQTAQDFFSAIDKMLLDMKDEK